MSEKLLYQVICFLASANIETEHERSELIVFCMIQPYAATIAAIL